MKLHRCLFSVLYKNVMQAVAYALAVAEDALMYSMSVFGAHTVRNALTYDTAVTVYSSEYWPISSSIVLGVSIDFCDAIRVQGPRMQTRCLDRFSSESVNSKRRRVPDM